MLIRGETFSGLWRAENRSQHGDLSLIKELAEEVLCVLEGPARSSDRLETPEGDTKDGQNVTTETPDPNTSQPGPSSDLTTGGDCETLLTTRGPLSVPLARLYFAEAVVAVEYLHSYGVVHRDLKPENLLITPTGHIKVADFGLSTVGVMTPKTNTHKESVEDITREFQDREECGTPSYMAPEIILKKGYGRPADWWSMGIILHRLLLGYVPFHGDTLTELRDNIVGGDINWDWDCAPPPDAQDLISDLLRTNPAQRIGTGGAFEIKSHPFLSDIDFDNLLSQKPEYIPQLVSDVDTSLFINHADPDNQMVSEEEDTSVDNESLYFQNFTSSSERLSKLCTIATRITNNEDPKSPLVCTPASDINIPGMQKKSFPEPDRDDAITSLPSSSPLSEQEKSENVEKGKKRRGSIFRRILSSCRRGLSRAARVFTCCCRSPTDI
ncbi:microtubule-associated serine/threonine-protein kinase 1-like [Dendrobates tinctorius]|uniref:microtubule-associated serine/threonine-protein kinase 1-like n=1 Tax=Dendrobates tinctorius TaxID=92724 RepID=UPI003CC945D7